MTSFNLNNIARQVFYNHNHDIIEANFMRGDVVQVTRAMTSVYKGCYVYCARINRPGFGNIECFAFDAINAIAMLAENVYERMIDLEVSKAANELAFNNTLDFHIVSQVNPTDEIVYLGHSIVVYFKEDEGGFYAVQTKQNKVWCEDYQFTSEKAIIVLADRLCEEYIKKRALADNPVNDEVEDCKPIKTRRLGENVTEDLAMLCEALKDVQKRLVAVENRKG